MGRTVEQILAEIAMDDAEIAHAEERLHELALQGERVRSLVRDAFPSELEGRDQIHEARERLLKGLAHDMSNLMAIKSSYMELRNATLTELEKAQAFERVADPPLGGERAMILRARQQQAAALERRFAWARVLPKETAQDIISDFVETSMNGEMTAGARHWFMARTCYWLLYTSVVFAWNKYVMKRYPTGK